MIVHHFGPDPQTIGGMGSAIRVFTENNIGGEVVDSHSSWRPQAPLANARLAVSAARALLQAPAADVVHVHLSEGGSFVREGALVALAHRRGMTVVVSLHGASFLPFARRHPRLVSAVLSRTELITCFDAFTQNVVRRSTTGVPCELLPNPVIVDRDSVPADKTDELVLFAGELGLRKGADVLSQAWRIVAGRRPDARCVMVGPVGDFSPPKAERLEVRAPVDQPGVRALLRQARVLALPSRAEGMPMILTEAMSFGRPFVSTPVGAIPELAAGGGTLVPVGDSAALADRLCELLADPALARSIGERGRQFCLETRSVEVIDARVRELYAAAALARTRRVRRH